MDNRLYYALELPAVALCGGRALFMSRNRLGWLALTLGVASFAAGDLAWAFWIAELENPPYPSIADALYLGFYPAAYVGLVLLFRAHVGGATGGLWLGRRRGLLALFLATATLAVVVARLGLTFRENRRLLELSRHEAVTDPLTGLANRRKLLDDLARRLEVVTPEEPWLLALYDLDGFKSYNDAFGHPAGDTLLLRVGHRLAKVPGAERRPYRLGGDQFCLLAPAADGAAERLLDVSARALEERGEGFEISSSFGAVLLPLDARDAREALRLADARLYAQKHQKRARRDRPHEALLQALYERGAEMHTHLQDVAALADQVGRMLGLTEAELDELHLAAQLHDIGKLAIPDEVLRKPGPLDDDERRFVEHHTVVGERILCASPALRGAGLIVRSTHERWDGTAYPDALAQDEIPIAARIISACGLRRDDGRPPLPLRGVPRAGT
jgi:two-component system, cell cycle response regulator